MNEDKLILDIHVVIDQEQISRLGAMEEEVVMIPFTGSASGPIFDGVIEPGGVDTQVVGADGIRHLSARYMLKGIDRAGQECRIYVANEGFLKVPDEPGPFTTVPSFITDSEALRPYLHQRRFVGKGVMKEDGLHILIYDREAI